MINKKPKKKALCMVQTKDNNIITYLRGLEYELIFHEDDYKDQKLDLIIINPEKFEYKIMSHLLNLKVHNFSTPIFLLTWNMAKHKEDWNQYIYNIFPCPSHILLFHNLLQKHKQDNHRPDIEIYKRKKTRFLNLLIKINKFDRYSRQCLNLLDMLITSSRTYDMNKLKIFFSVKENKISKEKLRNILIFLSVIIKPENMYIIKSIDRGIELENLNIDHLDLIDLSELCHIHNLTLITHEKTDHISITYN